MVIGIDIDDTITNTTMYANKIYHNNQTYTQKDDYHLLDKEEYDRFLEEYSLDIVSNVSLKDECKRVIDKWHKQGHKIIIVTARGNLGNYQNVLRTCLYLNKYGIYYDKCYFYECFKSDVALKENIDIFIDDKEEILDNVAKNNIKTIRIADTEVISNHQVLCNFKKIDEFIEKYARGYL